MPCAALDRSVTVTSTSAERTDFRSSATLSGSSDQQLRPSTGATQQRNRYFLHEKYASPCWGVTSALEPNAPSSGLHTACAARLKRRYNSSFPAGRVVSRS